MKKHKQSRLSMKLLTCSSQLFSWSSWSWKYMDLDVLNTLKITSICSIASLLSWVTLSLLFQKVKVTVEVLVCLRLSVFSVSSRSLSLGSHSRPSFRLCLIPFRLLPTWVFSFACSCSFSHFCASSSSQNHLWMERIPRDTHSPTLVSLWLLCSSSWQVRIGMKSWFWSLILIRVSDQLFSSSSWCSWVTSCF